VLASIVNDVNHKYDVCHSHLEQNMFTLTQTLLFSAIMGLSITLPLPLILKKNESQATTKLLIAVAIGILVFLIGDVFVDAAQSLYNGSLYGYGSSPSYDVIFALSLTIGFLALLLAGRRKKASLTPTQLALMIAVGIGFQNLTEGLLFGSLSVLMGLTGAALVVLVGFIFQNLTEGFPIASPFLGSASEQGNTLSVIAGALLLAGIPTVIGGAVGYYYNSTAFDLVFDGLAIGTMLYVILPMLGNLLRETDSRKLSIPYFGIFLGFILGFLVNLL